MLSGVRNSLDLMGLGVFTMTLGSGRLAARLAIRSGLTRSVLVLEKNLWREVCSLMGILTELVGSWVLWLIRISEPSLMLSFIDA